MKKTHSCGELTIKNVGQDIVLEGWVHSRRDHGGLLFIDIRDRFGLTQIIFDVKNISKENYDSATTLRDEFVIRVYGKVVKRMEGTINAKLNTGEIEISANKLEILNASLTPPFLINDDAEVGENTRLKYRYLDLRRPAMQRNLITRHKVAFEARAYLNENNFLEIETPVLTKSTPEGARDYLVPSRVNPGNFYALPQSPQLFKQLLMVSGYERYFQIVRCFRDEDLRADRQPEHTQIDMELSFVDQEDVYKIVEGLIVRVFKNVLGVELKAPFARITYDVAMNEYGSDKPDLRFDMKLKDVTEVVKDVEFKVFSGVIKSGGVVKCVVAPGCASYSLGEMDKITKYAMDLGAKGMAWFKLVDGAAQSPIAKFFKETDIKNIKDATGAKDGDLVLFIADKKKVANTVLGGLRLEMAKRLNLIDKSAYCFEWVVDFLMFEWSDEDERFVAVHHPFTSPKTDDINELDKNPGELKAKAYDIVLNGVELGGGSIRIHKRDMQEKIFQILGINKEEAQEKFGFLLDAFQYGTPPHGGLAIGLDRFIMLMLKLDSIREVIAFPKTQKAACLMTNAPSKVSEKQLRELYISVEEEK